MHFVLKNIIFVGILLYFGLINAQNINQLMAKAKKGDPSSQLFLGLCYQEGRSVQKNDSLAIYWLNKSARQGLSEAQVMLANCYKEGRGVEKDSIKAFELYEQASWSGGSLSLDAMGDCYYYGIGVQRDVIRARYYYSKAAKRGFKKSKIKYDKIRFKKDEDELLIL
ncbi:MAG: tetratricopeptide repeat protein [Bacteroidales bacterium]